MLDQFLVGNVERISPEAPVPVVKFIRDEFRLGGAANVAHNVSALGGRVTLVGLVGDDDRTNYNPYDCGDGMHGKKDEFTRRNEQFNNDQKKEKIKKTKEKKMLVLCGLL